jgi:penicillin amidase
VNVDAAPSYRFDRISERLAATSRHTAGTLAAVQMDVKLNRARRLVPAILADLESGAGWSAIEREAIALLRSWDFEATAGSTATAVFFTTYREAVVAALRDELDPAGFEFLLSQRYSTNVADLWFDAADHPVWDDRATPAPETRADVVRAAFRRAVARLVADLGPSPADWRWGRLHTLQIKHAFGGQKSLAGFVNLPVAEVGGGLDSVWKSHFDLGNEKAPFAAMAGPAYRHVVDLADIRHGLWVSDTGVSGWPGSPHYGDQHERWKRGEFFPMVSDWDDIRKGAKAVVTLVPASAVEGK